MLSFLALFGAMGAGFVAQALMSRPEAESGDLQSDGPEEGSADPAPEELAGNLLDQVTAPDLFTGYDAGSVVDGMPMSDDIADRPRVALVLSGTDGPDHLTGDAADDDLRGGDGDDQISGLDGADSLWGAAGRDHLLGGNGGDALFGGTDADVLSGGAGDDLLEAGAGDDFLAGHEGDDSLNGGDGADVLHGGEGADSIDAGAGDDWATGGAGDDLLVGGAGADTLDGGAGADRLMGHGDADSDFLNGGLGDDLLLIGAGDLAHGGEGADDFVLHDILPGAPLAEIQDYDPAEDRLTLLYDPAVHPDPVITVAGIDGTPHAIIAVDGIDIALVYGGAGLSHAAIGLRAA